MEGGAYGAGKRRTWRKLQMGLDPETGEIVTAVLTTADMHDAEALPDLLSRMEGAVKAVVGDGGYDTRHDYS